MTKEEWMAKGKSLFGDDMMKWKFICPVCGHEQSAEDYKAAGAPSTVVAFSCIGRYLKESRDAFGGKGKGPCNYAGGGLFRVNPVEVEGQSYFEFAH